MVSWLPSLGKERWNLTGEWGVGRRQVRSFCLHLLPECAPTSMCQCPALSLPINWGCLSALGASWPHGPRVAPIPTEAIDLWDLSCKVSWGSRSQERKRLPALPLARSHSFIHCTFSRRDYRASPVFTGQISAKESGWGSHLKIIQFLCFGVILSMITVSMRSVPFFRVSHSVKLIMINGLVKNSVLDSKFVLSYDIL